MGRNGLGRRRVTPTVMRFSSRPGPLTVPFALAAALALGIPSACAGGAAVPEGPPAVEIVAPDSLAARWASALDSPARRGVGVTWIGWSVEHPRAGLVMSNTGPPDLRRGPTGSIADRIGVPRALARDRVGLLFALRPGTNGPEGIVGTRIRSLDAPVDLGDAPVVWLGEAEDAESVALLESVFPRIRSRQIQTELGPMVAVHRDPDVSLPALRRILMGAWPEEVRAEAMAWIGWLLPDERAARLVAEALRHDPSLLVLDEALTMIDEAGGSPALMTALLDRLASDPEPGARALIAEALGAVRDPRAEAALRAAASGDPSHLVRDEARDALEEAAELRGDR